MPTTEQTVEKISGLAHIELTQEDVKQFTGNLSTFLDMTRQLHAVDTHHVTPLFHPLDLHQALRDDQVSEANHVHALAQLAPLFEQDLYLVPKVIETGK